MKKIIHKRGKEHDLIIIGKPTKAEHLENAGKNISPFHNEDLVGEQGGLKYTLTRTFTPLNKDIKIITLDTKMSIAFLNHPCIYLNGIISFTKGNGNILLRLFELTAKTEHIKLVYFATESTNKKMITLAYRRGYTPFAMQEQYIYFGKDIQSGFKETKEILKTRKHK